MNFTKETVQKILQGKVDSETLAELYPDLNDSVINSFSSIHSNSSINNINSIISSYRNKASFAIDKINKSNGNTKTINRFYQMSLKLDLQ